MSQKVTPLVRIVERRGGGCCETRPVHKKRRGGGHLISNPAGAHR